jgi:hypothetical protein
MSQEKLEKLKVAVDQTKHLNEEEKSLTLQKIEEWRLEDRAMELLPAQLNEISKKIVPMLEEVGLL